MTASFILFSRLLPSKTLTPSPLRRSNHRRNPNPSTLFLFLSPKSAMSSQPDPHPDPEPEPDPSRSTRIPDDSKAPSYPTPLSPPLPPISKEIELSRAMTASSKSSVFSLSRNDVVYEDEWLIAVNKAQGVYCESVLSSVPRLLEESLDLDSLGTQGPRLELHLANRLDRDTSGVMLITKSHKVASKLVKAFANHKVRKTYLALCTGSAPNWDRITLKSGHGRSKFGAWRVYAASDVGRELPGGSVVRDMETGFEVLSVNGNAEFGEPSEVREDAKRTIVIEEKSSMGSDQMKDEILLRAYPKSGRTHQIRLHCQYLGMPIKGDVKYEGVCEWKGEVCDGHLLHAESLSFQHPVTGLPVLVQVPMPSWLSQALHQQKFHG